MIEPRTAGELRARVDDAWKSFRESVRHVGRAKLDQPTGAGWTFHDLVAHVAGWHDLTARRLRAFRTTGAMPGPGDEGDEGDEGTLGVPVFADADEFNERLVSSHRLVGAEALLDELDTTFQAVRGELVLLTDEQLHANDGRVIRVVEGNTYGHYAEHAAELGIR